MKFKFFTILFYVIILFTASINAGNCTIDWGTLHQSIRGFGACSAWSSGTFPSALATFFFNTSGSNLGISMYRTRIPPDGTMTGEISMVQQALAINPSILVWAAPWSPPASMKNTDNVDTGVLLTADYQAYANYLTTYAKDFQTAAGVGLYAMSVQNEPDWPPGTYEGCTWSAQQLHDFILNNFGPAMASSNPNVKIMMPESFGDVLAMSDTTLNDSSAAQYVSVIGEHLYGLSGNEPKTPNAYALAVSLGKEYWETEFYNNSLSSYDATMTEGLNTAVQMHNALTIANFNAYHYWWFVSSGTDNGGLVPNGTTSSSGAPKTAFCFGQFSKFIRPGYVRMDSTVNPTSGVYVSAYQQASTGDFVIVAINTNSSTTSQSFTLNAMSVSSVTPWVTDANNSLIQQGAQAVSGNSFTYNLTASSVTTFIGVSGNITVSPTVTFTITQTPTPVCGVELDNFASCSTTNVWGAGWYDFADTGTTLTPSPLTLATTSSGSSGCSAQISGTQDSGGYAGLGTNLDSAGTTVNMTAYTGVQFYVKGDGGNYWFQATEPSVTDGDNFGYSFTAPTSWTLITISFSSLAQRGFGTKETFTQNQLEALQWMTTATGSFNLDIDGIVLISSACNSPTNTPNMTKTNTPTLTRTPTTALSPTTSYTPTFTITVTKSYTMTATYTTTVTSTSTLINTYTATYTPTLTQTMTNTSSRTNTMTITNTLSLTSTVTATPTLTVTSTYTTTFTCTFTSSNTAVNTFTATQTSTDTMLPSETFTNTSTLTLTATNTSTRTNTLTITQTLAATQSITPTFTGTSTETKTATPTDTNSPIVSITPTSTNIIFTWTITLTFTVSPTITQTYTPSPSLTNTSTPTITITRTYTLPPTASCTATPTYTETMTITCACLTNTVTPTFTAINTATLTDTPTCTSTGTPTITDTITFTDTPTNTPTRTLTNNVSITLTYTPTGTNSMTLTDTETPIVSATPTYTSTVYTWTITQTSTETPVITMTNTEINTATPTDTQVDTVTMTQTETEPSTPTATEQITQTSTNTLTVTETEIIMTATNTQTQEDTATFTQTQITSPSATIQNTSTNTVTTTQTEIPSLTITMTNTLLPTFTYTPIPSLTFTTVITAIPTVSSSQLPTATITGTSTQQIIISPTATQGPYKKPKPYPNPINPYRDPYLKIAYDLDKDTDSVTIKIYTVAYRLIMEYTFDKTGVQQILQQGIECPTGQLRNLSNGSYFYVIITKSGNKYTNSAVDKFIIIK